MQVTVSGNPVVEEKTTATRKGRSRHWVGRSWEAVGRGGGGNPQPDPCEES